MDRADENLRKRLLDGVDDLHGQDKQIQNTKKMGLETNDLMRQANKELRN